MENGAQKAASAEARDDAGGKIKIGVCVMEKKAFSGPMSQILDRLQAFGEFEIICFGDKVILEEPVANWPICDCLIAFYSSGYPLQKAEAYAALRKPFLVNELAEQHLLHDRRKVYERLEMFGIPVPNYALVNRETPFQELDYFMEQDDFVEVHGIRFWKPFVEKPIDGDDHSIMIYYPSSAGGGMKELFRKVGNRSSEFHPEVRRVRREGSYIYEEFMPTGGTDVKIECKNRLEEENVSVQIHSYGDLGERAFGACGRFLMEVLVLVSQAGGAIVYLVFIGQNLSSVFSAPDCHRSVAPSAFIFLLLLPLEIALSFFRSLSAITPFSALADACNVLAMGTVLKDDLQLLGDPFRAPPGGRPAFRGAWGLPFAVRVSVLCFEGFSMTLPLEASMAEREMFRWVLSRAFLGIIFGCLAYGDLTLDIITLNLPNDWSAAAVKVYTVGPEYAHAEARKSPVVDGVVMRNLDGKEIFVSIGSVGGGLALGKEGPLVHTGAYIASLLGQVRYPVLLTPAEKQMARDVCIAFRQAVCGFDLLRCEGRSYVCDVNGWSFVKNSHKYYDDAACVLRKMFLDAKAPHLSSTIPPILPWKVNEPVPTSEGLTRQGSGIIGTFGQSEELRCVIAIVRHGDRTPKQKVKLKVTEEKLLNLMLKYNGGRPRAETKLKSAVQLQDLLDATRTLVPKTRSGRESDSDAEELEHAEKLRQVKAVLEEGGHFSGIYRKVQLKPLKWAKVPRHNGDGEEERPIEALMVLKYGGVLTHAGRKQAEELGRYFRNNMYPGEGTGLLRLHSTYRHDLKIYSSDEGRVQMSAAAFAKGLLDLEGQLTPILVSLVSKDSSMLDGLEDASTEMEEAKARLHEIINSEAKVIQQNGHAEFLWMIDGAGLPPDAYKLLPRMVQLTKKITEQVKLLAEDEDEKLALTSSYSVLPPYDQAKALGKTNIDVARIAAGLPCGSESFLLMFARWKKLERDLYNERKDRFDITQIPDVYDSCKYDLLHNSHLNLEGLDELFKVAQVLADGVIPNEYGINPKQKLKIGSEIARRLLGKILIDLRNTQEEAISVAELKGSQDQSSNHVKSRKEDADYQLKALNKNDDVRKSSSTNEKSLDQDDDDDKETKYRLDPKYANVKTPERHVRTRLYFTSESHIHSLMNVLRYCNLDESLQGEESLVCTSALERLFRTRELDYMSYIVLRMFENTEVSLEDPKRVRIEMTFSRGADLSPLEYNEGEAASLHQEHTLPIMGPERLQEAGSYLTLEKMEKMFRPFAMPAEDFPPPATPIGFSGYFSKSAGMLERLASLWPFNKHVSANRNIA